LSSGLVSGATTSILADVTTTSDLDYYTLIAPAGASTLQVSVQSAGLSLLSPFLKVYNASQTVVASASGSGSDGTVVTTTISVTPGSRYYILVDGANTTASGTGTYALNLGINTSAPLASSPNTQLVNGNPISAGGGQAVQKGQEFLVNSFTNDTQQTSAGASHSVAVDEAGDFVVTWASNNQDGNGW